MADFIRIENLIFDYVKHEDGSAHRAIDNVSFSVEKGSFTAVIGQNGSGKSTLAKNINGLLVPTSGKIYVDGMDTSEPEHIWGIRQKVAMVFQNPDNQIIAAIVEDDVAFGPENLGVEPEEIRRRVSDSLQAVGMLRYRKFAPHLLSGGQKQRIAIAGALAMHTECLVFDEPTAMLDPVGRMEVLSSVKKLHEQFGITILYITHFMEEAAAADRILVMEHGRIVDDGTPLEVFSKVDKMKKIGLDVPLATEVAWRLRKKGVRLPQNILTDEDLVTALCQ